jgi:hypothetical protein
MTYDPVRPAEPESFTPAAPEPATVTSVTPVAPVTPAATRKGSGRLVNVALAIAVAVAIGGVAFAVGRSTAPASAAAFPGRFGNGFGNGGQFPTGSGAPDLGGRGGFGGLGGNGGPTISGTVESVGGDTLTIKTASGQTIEVTLGSDTTYSTNSPATESAVTAGSNVQVRVDFSAGRGSGTGGALPSGPLGTASSVTVVP